MRRKSLRTLLSPLSVSRGFCPRVSFFRALCVGAPLLFSLGCILRFIHRSFSFRFADFFPHSDFLSLPALFGSLDFICSAVSKMSVYFHFNLQPYMHSSERFLLLSQSDSFTFEREIWLTFWWLFMRFREIATQRVVKSDNFCSACFKEFTSLALHSSMPCSS